MAIVKLALATISGPMEQIDIAIQSFVINRPFHPENAVSHMQNTKALIPFDLENKRNVLPAVPATGRGSSGGACPETSDLEQKLQSLTEAASRMGLDVTDNHDIIESLERMCEGEDGLLNLLKMKSAESRYGRMPKNIYLKTGKKIDARNDVFFVQTSEDKDYVYGMYFALPSAKERVDTFFAALQFELLLISDKVHGTSQEAIETLENAIYQMQNEQKLQSFDLTSPYTPIMTSVKEMAGILNITLGYRAFDPDSTGLEQVTGFFNNLSGELRALTDEAANLNLAVADNQNIIETLTHLHNVGELDAFLKTKSVKFRFGRIPKPIYEEACHRIEALRHAYYVTTSIEADFVYGIYFVLPSAKEHVDQFFASLEFEKVWISEKVHGTPTEAIEALRLEMGDARLQALTVADKLSAIKSEEENRFLEYYSYLMFLEESFSLRGFAGHTADSFYIVGWLPLAEAESFAAEVESVPGFSCVLSEADDIPDINPPIKQKSGLLARIYTPFVEMYGLPSYREIDPTLFMAITYTILFGVMFGDVGQGVVLFIAGLLLHRLRGMWLGRILACAGISATAFGFVYGSIFGFEDILPGFKVMEGDGAMQMLIIAALVGILLVSTCMVVNIINGIKQRDWGKILFSHNGLSGLIFYLSAVIGLICAFVYNKNLFSVPYTLFFIVLPLLLILFHKPLSKRIRGAPDWKPKSMGSFLTEGFFELFEVLLSFISNTISFLRVGAFAISHAGMMMVVLLLAGGSGGSYNIFILVFGNLFVMVLETMLVCIQLLRLEFYEMFGRFFESGGVKFKPYDIDYENSSKSK